MNGWEATWSVMKWGFSNGILTHVSSLKFDLLRKDKVTLISQYLWVYSYLTIRKRTKWNIISQYQSIWRKNFHWITFWVLNSFLVYSKCGWICIQIIIISVFSLVITQSFKRFLFRKLKKVSQTTIPSRNHLIFLLIIVSMYWLVRCQRGKTHQLL